MARSKKTPIGFCHVCGTYGKLTFEHVPPRAAYNHRPIMRVGVEKMLSVEPGTKVSGPYDQRGAGGYTLCGWCNSFFGRSYVPDYLEWVRQLAPIVLRGGGESGVSYPIWCKPLLVLKQIAAMFFSVNAPWFRTANPELRRFVMSPMERGLPPYYRFFTYLVRPGGNTRFCGVSVGGDFSTRTISVITEIAFPPTGFVLAFDSRPADSRLVEITDFSRCGVHELRQLWLPLKVMPIDGVMPGDFRPLNEIRATYQSAQEPFRPTTEGVFAHGQPRAESMLDHMSRMQLAYQRWTGRDASQT